MTDMTAQAPTSTVDSRAAALAMFAGNVPCIFELHDPPCLSPALWLAGFAHEETDCGKDDPWPLCEQHKKRIQAVSKPFWRVWHNLTPIPCSGCGTPLRLDRFDAIQS